MRHRDRKAPDRRLARRHGVSGRRLRLDNVILSVPSRNGLSNGCNGFKGIVVQAPTAGYRRSGLERDKAGLRGVCVMAGRSRPVVSIPGFGRSSRAIAMPVNVDGRCGSWEEDAPDCATQLPGLTSGLSRTHDEAATFDGAECQARGAKSTCCSTATGIARVAASAGLPQETGYPAARFSGRSRDQARAALRAPCRPGRRVERRREVAAVPAGDASVQGQPAMAAARLPPSRTRSRPGPTMAQRPTPRSRRHRRVAWWAASAQIWALSFAFRPLPVA